MTNPATPKKHRPGRKPHKMREEYALPDEVKRRIVRDLATFRTTGEVQEMLLDEYQIEMPLKDIIRFDATKGYCITGTALQELFHGARKEYCEGVAELHIANQAYRLRRLMEMALKAERKNDFKLAAEIYEQAAKDHGGAFTNERKLNGTVQHTHMTPEKARATIEEFLAKPAEKPKPARPTKH